MRSLFLVFCILMCVACKQKAQIQLPLESRVLIPKPLSVEAGNFAFTIDTETLLITDGSKETKAIAELFRTQIEKSAAIKLEKKIGEEVVSNSILFKLSEGDSISAEEGYRLEANHNHLALVAKKPQGLYRGMQTLMQLLPDDVVVSTDTIKTMSVPGVKIFDAPEFVYRGAMLDVARHFFSVSDVKRYIDLIASYKINTLHLHLADDQGWRIEIKSWPKLTEIGGSTAVGGGEGGFYTQEDYREIVAYAAARYITIIPEIDMPGHTNAALASYPELNCNGKATKLYTGMRVGFSSLCVDKEITYTFLDDVIGELAALTPGDYIHIGGDESHATAKKDYIIFLNKAQDIVKKHGKNVMGWEDIAAADVLEGTIIQHWTNPETAIKAIEKGAKVVLSPAPKTYLDMKYDAKSRIGLTWAGPTSVDSAYLWNPHTILKDVARDKILGIESPLWSETVINSNDIDYLSFPRLIGHAELGWSASGTLNWVSYKSRLRQHRNRLDLLKVKYYPAPMIFGEN